MATGYIIDPDRRLIRITFSGRVSVAEMYEGRRDMMADPAFRLGYSRLVDARSVTSLEMNGYSVKKFAQEHAVARGGRRAIVMSSAPVRGLARMFQIYRELAGATEVTELFDDMDNALRWLGLPADYLGK
jgi:hypothetical protein